MNHDGPDRIALAVEEAYADHGEALFRFALRLCGSRDDAEDVVVETFAHAYRQWDAFSGKGTRRSWLYGIAINRFRMS
ncbi:RNA polymerase sigma factor, partial [bacterium]